MDEYWYGAQKQSPAAPEAEIHIHLRMAQAAGQAFQHIGVAGLDRFAVQEPFQVASQVGGSTIALGRLFLQAFQANGIQVPRDFGLQDAWGNRVQETDLFQGFQKIAGQERRPAG